jgi:hypothetical protein
MPCKVGITTDPVRRRSEWMSQVVGLSNWRLLKRFSSRERAQEYEDWYAQRYGCQAHHGGMKSRGPWYVYRFDYTRVR